MTEDYTEAERALLKRARTFGSLYYICAMAILVVPLLLGEPEPHVDTTFLSMVMLAIMPVDLLMILILYRVFTRRVTTETFFGLTFLLYIFPVAIGILGFVVAFVDLSFRVIATVLGATLSSIGFASITYYTTNFLSHAVQNSALKDVGE